MADRFPLILNTSANQIQEIASGDTLDLTGNNISNAGVITATSFSGPIVAGAGTSNITAGIITAVAADIDDFVDVGSNIQLGNAGVITATTFKGDGDFVDLDVDGHTNLDNVSIAGVTTMTGMLRIDSGNLQVYGTAPTIFLRDTDNNPDYRIMNSHGSYKIFDETNGVDRFVINSNGKVDILYDLDVDGHTNLDNVSIAGVTTMTGALTISSTTDQMLNLNSSDNNGVSLAFQRNGSRQGYIGYGGASNGLIIANEVSNGAVVIQGNDGGSIINMLSFASDNKGLATIHGGATIPLDLDVDGHTNLDNVSIAGVTTFQSGITGTTASFSGNVSIGGVLTYEDVTNVDSVGIVTARNGIKIPTDNKSILLGADDDLSVLHSGSTGVINNVTGDLHIKTTGSGDDIILISNDDIELQPQAGEDGIKVIGNGAVELYHDGNKRLETKSTGIELHNGCLDLNRQSVLYSAAIYFDSPTDTNHMLWNDYYGHPNSSRTTTGNFDGIKWNCYAGLQLFRGNEAENIAKFLGQGACELYHANQKRFETTTDGVSLIGSDHISNGTIQVNDGVDGDCFRAINSGAIKWCVGTDATTTGTVSFDARTYDTNKGRLHKWTSPSVAGGSYGNYSEAWYDGAAYRHITCHGDGFKFNHHLLPEGTVNLGSSSARWNDIYTNDLNLSNEGGANEVDGTWGNYTIQEGESDLFLINNRSGKKYKFNLTEVS